MLGTDTLSPSVLRLVAPTAFLLFTLPGYLMDTFITPAEDIAPNTV